MELEGSRLILREMDRFDACDLFEIYCRKDAVAWLSIPVHVTIEETLQGIDDCLMQCAMQNLPPPWVLIEKNNDHLIGTIDLHHRSSLHTMEIGFLLHPDYWRQGYMSEAMEIVLTYGFETLQLHRITALCAVENEASVALLKHFSFQQEGLLPDYTVLSDGKYHDLILFSLMREEWRNQNEERIGSQI